MMNRKNLGDGDAEVLFGVLEKNDTLQKLCLEGNLLGPSSARAFSRVVRNKNSGLVVVDLSNNLLTNCGKDQSGVLDLAESVASNYRLRELNIRGNSVGTVRPRSSLVPVCCAYTECLWHPASPVVKQVRKQAPHFWRV
eukprot:GHVU01146953.1.p1 GENE.GHVU01146953.1~~GHVU01146953.1.p1  ORF type:complete len:139 (+),score=3.25 GHVU01146953.1:775-1191(+)